MFTLLKRFWNWLIGVKEEPKLDLPTSPRDISTSNSAVDAIGLTEPIPEVRSVVQDAFQEANDLTKVIFDEPYVYKAGEEIPGCNFKAVAHEYDDDEDNYVDQMMGDGPQYRPWDEHLKNNPSNTYQVTAEDFKKAAD